MRFWALLASSAASLFAQSEVVFEGQYRGRLEVYDGVNKAAYGDEAIDPKGIVRGKSNDTLYLQQLIAGVTYTPSDEWEYKLYLYDSRSWGSSLGTQDFALNPGTPDQYLMDYYDDRHELYTTYVRRKNCFDLPLTVTLGRQKLGYGDRRVFGPGEWGNTMGWLWDALHVSYREGENFLDAWYGQTRTKDPGDFSLLEKHRYQGIGLYGHVGTFLMNVEPFFAWKNPLYHAVLPYQDFYYVGVRLYREGIGWNIDLTGVKEFGRSGTTGIDAYGYVAKGGYRWNAPFQPKLTGGITYASGDKNPNDAAMGTFSTPFGMTDGPHYGRADIMAWSNLKDYEVTFETVMTPETKVQIGVHRFELADAHDKWYEFGYKNKPGNYYTHLGDEADLIVEYKIAPKVNLLGIASYFTAGEFIRKNGIARNDASKIFVQFEYRFSSRD